MNLEQPTLDLLKLIFGKSKDGKWVIQSMQTVPLRPRNGAETDFFPIRDDLITAQPTFLGTIKYLLGQSIVPIVAHVQGENELRCLGTGFFVSCSGMLVTAAHVITDPIERQYGGVEAIDSLTWRGADLKIGVMIPVNPLLQGDGYIFRDIEWASFLGEVAEHPLPIAGVNLKLTSDTAICKVSPIAAGIPHQPLTIVQSGISGAGMALGKRAIAVGYGQMKNVHLTQESDRTVSGDFAFDLHASSGEILERFPDNLIERQVSTPGACFSAALKLPGGMSGSPIFDDEGIYVHGVVSKGWVDQGGIARFGYGSMLAHSLGVPITTLENKSLLDLFKNEEHGFAKLSGPGM